MIHSKICEPEITKIKDDEYYLLYEMMMQSLKTDDVIGGDEFVLLTRLDEIKDTLKKAEKAREEAFNIKLKEDEQIIVGLNYGIVKHRRGSSIKQTYIEADKRLSEDKKQMYLKLGLDRRR